MNRWSRLFALVAMCWAFSSAQPVVQLSVAGNSIAIKREFRGAWIATVINLDWPSSKSLSPQQQRDELTSLLDNLYATGINAVIFQVRVECDAYYSSPYEPWSYWLTGQQGKSPSPLYDPLTFAIQEAHKRGMELHAWFNPYRAVRNTNPSSSTYYAPAANHLSVTNPSWILPFPTVNLKVLNPGLPEVRDHVAKIVADVVRRYEVDGIHMDDYFYPYPAGSFPGITTEDNATFAAYSRGISNIGDWRRDNINLLIKQIYDSVQAIKPWVKFGMSPFGIWRPSNPPGISGLDAYATIYCDALAWLRARSIDYLTPQLYWAFGGGQDYGKLMPWWADSVAAYGRHFYTGNATYKLNPSEIGAFSSASEISNQIRWNRASPKTQGSIQFRAKSITANYRSFADSSKYDLFRYPSIIPSMPWKETVPPLMPSNLTVNTDPQTNLQRLRWDPPLQASDGDSAKRYLVYRFSAPRFQTSDQEYPKNLLALTGQSSLVPSARIDTSSAIYYYAVSSIDKNNNESGLTNIVAIHAPVTVPILASPINGEQNFPRTGVLRWNRVASALAYRIEVGTSANFTPSALVAAFDAQDTLVANIPSLLSQTTYYWRVVAGSQGEVGAYSVPFSFRTGWPAPPTPLSPANITNAPRFPTFSWTRAGGTSFRVRVTNTVDMSVQIDTTVTDTTFTSNKGLPAIPVYSWQVIAINSFGSSEWSTEARFRVDVNVFAESSDEVPTEYQLSQNYPNPFNPLTHIEFALPREGFTTLKVYDLLGREVRVLLEENLRAGRYRVNFDASLFPSGTYFYMLASSDMRLVKKMVLVK